PHSTTVATHVPPHAHNLSRDSHPPPAPHSFPTRRSSDLPDHVTARLVARRPSARTPSPLLTARLVARRPSARTPSPLLTARLVRSGEHTSELQSPDHLVCRLLLEKTKTITLSRTTYPPTS